MATFGNTKKNPQVCQLQINSTSEWCTFYAEDQSLFASADMKAGLMFTYYFPQNHKRQNSMVQQNNDNVQLQSTYYANNDENGK